MKKRDFKRNPYDHTKIVQKAVITNSPVVNEIINSVPSYTDPFGSYTGRPLDENDVPMQDQDDL